MELGKVINYNIQIEPSSNNGFIVKIGCGKFVAENVTSLLNGLKAYLENPKEWEKKYNSLNTPVETAAVPSRPRLEPGEIAN